MQAASQSGLLLHLCQMEDRHQVCSPSSLYGRALHLSCLWHFCHQSAPAEKRQCCRYGVKLEAVELLQDWVTSIGSQAGLTAGNCRLLSGAVGVPESSLEVRWCLQVLLMVPAGVCSLLSTDTAAGLQTSGLLGAKPRLPQRQSSSLLQMEVQFDSLTELEAFWSKIPAQVRSLSSSVYFGCCMHRL